MKVEKTVEYYEIELNEDVLTEEEQEELAQESDEESDMLGEEYGILGTCTRAAQCFYMKVLIVRTRLNR